MASPRFALVVGGPRSGSLIPAWPHGPGVAGERSGDGSWFGWRLLGGNNRELGRSATASASADLCRSAVDRVRGQRDDLIAVVNADADRGRWGWRLNGPEGPVAVCARFYLRQRECQYNLQQFLDGLARGVLWPPPVRAADAAPRDPADAPDVVIDLRDGRVPSWTVRGGRADGRPPQQSDGRRAAPSRRAYVPVAPATSMARAQAEQSRRRIAALPRPASGGDVL